MFFYLYFLIFFSQNSQLWKQQGTVCSPVGYLFRTSFFFFCCARTLPGKELLKRYVWNWQYIEEYHRYNRYVSAWNMEETELQLNWYYWNYYTNIRTIKSLKIFKKYKDICKSCCLTLLEPKHPYVFSFVLPTNSGKFQMGNSRGRSLFETAIICLHIHSWYKLRNRNILIYHIHTLYIQTHSRFYILKRIFLDTLKIGISQQWQQHWRQAIFYRPRKGGRKGELSPSWGTVKIKMKIAERRLSSLSVYQFYVHFGSCLFFFFIICQTSISSDSPPHCACISCASIHKFMCLSDKQDTRRRYGKGREERDSSLGTPEQCLCMWNTRTLPYFESSSMSKGIFNEFD